MTSIKDTMSGFCKRRRSAIHRQSLFETAGELFGVAVANLVKNYEIYPVILDDMICDE
jgi:hypothetical protein